jgi:hypothetical protein
MMTTPAGIKWLSRFKRDLETCVKTILSGHTSEKRENVLVWAADYVKVKVNASKSDLEDGLIHMPLR